MRSIKELSLIGLSKLGSTAAQLRNRRTPSRSISAQHLPTLAVCFAAGLMIADPAFAQGADGLNSLAQNVLGILQNGFVRIVAVIAVIIVGIGWLTGRIAFTTLLSVLAGIFIIFSAEWIVDTITGGL